MLRQRRLASVLVPLFSFRLFHGSLPVLALTGAASVVWGQATSTATITGQATDQQGASVAATEVRLIDNSTTQTQTTRTNDVGRYVFANVSPGT